MEFKDVNKLVENSNDIDTLQEKINDIVDDYYFTIMNDPDAIKRDIAMLRDFGKNYNDDEFCDINHYAWFRGENEGGKQENVIDRIDNVLKLAERIKSKLNEITQEIDSNKNNTTKNTDVMDVSLKIDLNKLSKKQYSDFQKGFDDLVDNLGINANVSVLDEVLIGDLNKKIDNKYLLEDINYHIENNELESYLGLSKDEWKNASVDDNNINNLLSYIADKRDEWRQESMNIDEVLDEFENSYEDTIEVNDIKNSLKDGKKVAHNERFLSKETNKGKEI